MNRSRSIARVNSTSGSRIRAQRIGPSNRKFVVAFIDMRLPRQQLQLWLFAGVQEVVGEEVREVERSVRERWGWSPWTAVRYQMQPRSACDGLKGLIVRFKRPWRYAYPRAEGASADA